MYKDPSPSGALVPEGAVGVGHGWARNLINYVSVLEGNKDMEKEYIWIRLWLKRLHCPTWWPGWRESGWDCELNPRIKLRRSWGTGAASPALIPSPKHCRFSLPTRPPISRLSACLSTEQGQVPAMFHLPPGSTPSLCLQLHLRTSSTLP